MIHDGKLGNGELMKDMPEGEGDGDGRGHRASMWELLCNYVIGKAKPLIFGQLLAFWLVRTLSCLIAVLRNNATELIFTVENNFSP